MAVAGGADCAGRPGSERQAGAKRQRGAKRRRRGRARTACQRVAISCPVPA